MKKLLSLFSLLVIVASMANAQDAGKLSIVNGGKVWALLYQQRAAEYKYL
jgi:Skp family chaperone for outer membrane proteins